VDALERLRAQARQQLGFYPTPLEELGRLRVALGERAPRLLVKRDDYTGFALGGNKVRKLEYELARARARLRCADHSGRLRLQPCTCDCGCSGSAASAVSWSSMARRRIRRANALLQRLFGAEIVNVNSREERAPRMEELANDVARAGKRALVVPLGASTPLGSLGYVNAALELAEQLRTVQLGNGAISIVLSASSAGTLAGLLVGLKLADLGDVRLIGVSPDDPASDVRDTAVHIAHGAAELIGYNLFFDWGVPQVTDEFVGQGYGIPSRASVEATRMFAELEGIVLDPAYTSKAAACLIDFVRAGRFGAHETVIFWHTGGAPAVFA
jgi:1-aminocyclopropane-1-carboxylate deaminase/D-cysteine desulfhydrase-like pyridoxal-dependent ACC family enzyme